MVDEKSQEMLEFPRIREIIAGHTSFSTSREMALNLQPFTDAERITSLLQQTTEAIRLLSVEPDFIIGELTDIREAAKMAARGKVLEPNVLIQVQRTLASIRQLRGNLSRRSKDFPLLWDTAHRLTEHHELEKAITSCLTPDGEILDAASAHLSELRHHLRDSREQLLSRLDAVIKSPRILKLVQEPIITEREGRYVIPIKIENRREMKGIVHDVSNTGATAFIEPFSTVELGNEVRELSLEERREVEKILAGLSARIGAYETEITGNILLGAELDFIFAKARYAHRARAAIPIVSGDVKIIRLVQARHPLLGEKAVPLSVEIGKDYSTLVITGPNTGGKTVALKTVGLLSLMALSGLPVPAAPETIIPVFDAIFADIGDEQSIEQTISSFSWHVGNIISIFHRATKKSLVLLDELGANTDPTEGSALARAILLAFRARETMTVATTHYSDLKAFAHVTTGMQNASFDFDPVTFMPTYHLTIGVPGGSNALTTASRLGLPPEIVAQAREMMSKGSRELESLLSDLVAQRQELDQERRDLEKQRGEVEARQTELTDELVRVKNEERKLVRETRDQLLQEAADLNRLIRDAESELKKAQTRERIEQAKKALAVSREQLRSETWQVKSESPANDEESIKAGDAVILKETQVYATVLSVSEETQQVEVQAGPTHMRLNRDSIEKIAPSAEAVSFSRHPLARVLPRREVAAQLDLRGKRADEIEPALDAYLNDASLANLSEVRIIHGVGTGVVRQITRDYLAGHPLVKSFRSGGRQEGGDGATVVTL